MSENEELVQNISSLPGITLFAELVQQVGTTTKTNEKLAALRNYFDQASVEDKVWVIALFSGRKPRRAISSTLLSAWCLEITGYPSWLFTESYHTVGDLAETIALLLPDRSGDSIHLEIDDTRPNSLSDFLLYFLRIEKQPEEIKKQFVLESWNRMNHSERFVFNKLITGSFRIGVSQKMMVNALSRYSEQDPSVIAHRISGNWDPAEISFHELINEASSNSDLSKPYPFYLAYALEQGPEPLGDPGDWQAEWKWDGIRGQIIKRNGELYVWSRGEELVTEKFPEYQALVPLLPDGLAIDGEILPFTDGNPLPFSLLQTRIGRKNITRKHLLDAPVVFYAYDIMEFDGEDIREKPLAFRRSLLKSLLEKVNAPALLLSPTISFTEWQELADYRRLSREKTSEGLMIKRLNSSYQVGRKRGDWWKWKIDPLSIDAVLIYAQKGSGRRSNLYTDYTFAVKDGDRLVSFAKAYSGLTDKEFAQVDNFVKRNSIEKFGPVRTVKPELVFEIGFEGIAESKRHKSGIALRFPRMLRWRKDKSPEEINTLEDLRSILKAYNG